MQLIPKEFGQRFVTQICCSYDSIKIGFVCLIFLPTLLLGVEKERMEAISRQTVEWVKEQLKGEIAGLKEKQETAQKILGQSEGSQCRNCFSGEMGEPDQPILYIFISFSVPDQVWLSLSQHLQGLDATFVLRGLPEDSFSLLSKKLQNLKKRGLNAHVQIDPRLFTRYDVSAVPAFVAVDEEAYDKVEGNISLQYALETMHREGESHASRELWERCKGVGDA